MKIFSFFIPALILFSGCTKQVDVNPPANTSQTDTMQTKPTGQPLTYLALGDSYTIGEAVEQPQSYPFQLQATMNSQGYAVQTPKVIATTGWTTDNLISAINASGIIGKQFDFVTLLIGVNDQFQGLNQDNYKIKFQQVLNTAITFAGRNKDHVFVLSIPDYGVTPFAGGNDAQIGPLIDQFNAINRKISADAGVNYLDITTESRQAANDPTLIASDGLHPSAKMYGFWVGMLAPMIEAKFRK